MGEAHNKKVCTISVMFITEKRWAVYSRKVYGLPVTAI